jgi:pre-mRNA-processing factor SLU7
VLCYLFCRGWYQPVAVYINNHTAVWGSWYDPGSGQWGFACCHSTVHLSYCTGLAGIEAAHASSAQHLLASSSSAIHEPEPPAESSSKTDNGGIEDRKKKAEELYSKKRLGEGDLRLNDKKLAEAVQAERKRKGRGDEEEGGSKRKKGGDSYEVTEEELGKYILTVIHLCLLRFHFIEAYRMTRRMTEDPMANYVDTDL